MAAKTLSKIVVVSINVVFMIFGLACLVVGIIFKLGWEEVRDAFNDNVKDVDIDLQTVGDTVAHAAIAFGAFILVLSLIGCLGACCEFKPLLIVYAVIVGLLIIAEVAIIGYGAVKANEDNDDLQKSLSGTLKDYHEDSSTSKSKAWSAIFYIADCCAVRNYTYDFNKNPFTKDTALRKKAGVSDASKIPITCCHGVDYENDLTVDVFKKHKDCLENPTSKNAYVEGCYEKVKDWIKHAKRVLIAVGCTILVLELLLVILAIFLVCRSE